MTVSSWTRGSEYRLTFWAEDVKLSPEQIETMDLEVEKALFVFSLVLSTDTYARNEQLWLLHSKPEGTAHTNCVNSLKPPSFILEPSILHQNLNPSFIVTVLPVCLTSQPVVVKCHQWSCARLC